MPARDAESTIVTALRSTLRSMPDDSEILVLDDASRDGTAKAVRSVRDKRIRLTTSSKSLGVATALNELLSSSEAEFIARMDADDISSPIRFIRQKRTIGGRDAIFASTVLFGSGSRLRVTPLAPLSPEGSIFALLLGNPFAHSTMFARRRAVAEVSGYRSCMAEDYDLWMRMAGSGRRLARDWSPAVALRQHATQVTAAAGWADRAAAEPEWQESYGQLLRKILPASVVSTVHASVSASGTPAKKAVVIAPLLREHMQKLSTLDRLSIRLLARREGVIL